MHNDYQHSGSERFGKLEGSAKMKEILLLKVPPVVLTKDVSFLENDAQHIRFQAGEIILLPEDAILVEATEEIHQQINIALNDVDPSLIEPKESKRGKRN